MDRQPLQHANPESRRAAPQVPRSATAPLPWQRALGNRGVERLFDAGVIQAKLRVSQPQDADELEADRVAAQVMRMPAARMDNEEEECRGCAGAVAPCARCAVRVQRRSSDGAATSRAHAPDGLTAALGNGRPLDPGARAFFEPRFGRDFGSVRVYTGAAADASTRSIDARAYTLGNKLVFAAGEYDAHSMEGRGLLAHELAHVVQQRDSAARVQRRLSVDTTVPTDPQDPLSRLGAAAFQSLSFSEMNTVVHSLCDLFSVNASGDVVTSPSDACDDLDAIDSGTKPVGCCCLCALTAPGSGAWTLNLTGIGGPRTEPASPSGGAFFLHPRSSALEFGTWNVAGARATADPTLVAGHELCGHGALLERGIHPTNVERVDTDVHDPTVRVENLIRAEQGLPGADRALAAGPHRGESFAHVTIRNYPFNGTAVPAGERSKIQLAKDFINANDTWVDVFGHSDLVGTPADKLSVSQRRADRVKAALTSGTRPVVDTISRTFGSGATGTATVTVSGDRFTRVEGRSDTDAIPGAAAAALRRVDIIMPGRPAGAEVPNAGTPTGIAAVGPQSALTFLRRRFGSNPCDRRLARSAWF